MSANTPIPLEVYIKLGYCIAMHKIEKYWILWHPPVFYAALLRSSTEEYHKPQKIPLDANMAQHWLNTNAHRKLEFETIRTPNSTTYGTHGLGFGLFHEDYDFYYLAN